MNITINNKMFTDNNIFIINLLKKNVNLSYNNFEEKFQNPEIRFIFLNSTVTAIKNMNNHYHM